MGFMGLSVTNKSLKTSCIVLHGYVCMYKKVSKIFPLDKSISRMTVKLVLLHCGNLWSRVKFGTEICFSGRRYGLIGALTRQWMKY